MKSPGKVVSIGIYFCIVISLVVAYFAKDSYAFDTNKYENDLYVLNYKTSDISIFDSNNLNIYGYDNSNNLLTVTLESKDNKNTYCYYDIYLKFIDFPYEYIPFKYRTSYDVTSSLYERSFTKELVNGDEEVKYAPEGLKIASSEVIHTRDIETITYNFNNLLYKAKDLGINSNINSYITIKVNDCYSKEFKENTYHYFVLEDDKYKELNELPVNDKENSYFIDHNRTYCVKKGLVIGYDNTLGLIDKPKGDECYIYFNRL